MEEAMESGTVEELGELLLFWANKKSLSQCSCVIAGTDELAIATFERAMSTVDCLYFRDEHGFTVGNPWPGPTHRVFVRSAREHDGISGRRFAVVGIDTDGISPEDMQKLREALDTAIASGCKVIELKGGRAA